MDIADGGLYEGLVEQGMAVSRQVRAGGCLRAKDGGYVFRLPDITKGFDGLIYTEA